jgi:hypothetical protein
MKEKTLECICNKNSGLLALLINLLEVRAISQRRWVDNIKIDLRNIGWDGVD